MYYVPEPVWEVFYWSEYHHLARFEGIILMNDRRCPSCGSVDLTSRGGIPSSRTFAGQHLSQTLSGGELLCCRSCALCFRFPRMSKAELDVLYRAGASDNWQHSSGARPDWALASRWINDLSGVKSVLDVGCFDGQFLASLGGVERFGVEIHEAAADRAKSRGIEIVGADYESLAGFSGRFDVVTSFDVIEHVHNPRYFVHLLAGALKPGGAVIISTGNTDALSWRFMGSRYWYCTIAEHISFINPRWYSWLSGELGLEIDRVQTFSHKQGTMSEKLGDLVKNAVYRLAPGLAAFARRRGMGGVDVGSDDALLLTPPNWLTARDHFIVMMRTENG